MAKRRLEELEPFHILRPGFTVDRLIGLADPFEITAYDIVPAILPDRGGHLLQHARFPEIVAVEESDVFSPGPGNTRFACPRNAPVRGAHHDDPRIALRIATQEPGRTVRGTVVHDDGLEIPECLRQNRLQARIEIPFQIVSGDDYRNLGRG